MADLPEVGLRAVIENLDGFQRGARTIAEAYEYVVKAEEKVAKQSPQAAAALQQLREAFIESGGDIREWADNLERELDNVGTAWDGMLKLMSLGALQQVSGTIGQVGNQLIGLAKQATLTAARAEELDAVLINLAEQNDLSAAAMRAQVQAIKDQGITTAVASNLVSQFVRSNLDLEQASNLARLAQDAAVISMEDSSQALQGLLHGILTLQPELLRYRGIIVDFQSEYKKWADANNRTVLSLTSAEKQSIALEAALAQGAQIAGTYEAAMDTAGKQIRSFSRYIEELKEDFGNTLLPVFTEGVFAAKALIKEIQGLPEPMKAAIAASGALTGGILKGASAMVSAGSQAAQLAYSLQQLGVAARLSSVAFLGPAGLAAGLGVIAAVSVASAIKANEEALRAEAAAIADSAETYQEYVAEAEKAEVGSYALTEGLFAIATGADAAKEGLDALTLTEAFRDLDMAIGGAYTGIEFLDEAFAKINQSGPVAAEDIREMWEQLLPTLSDAQLVVLRDEEAVRQLGESAGLTGDSLEVYTDTILKLANEQAFLTQRTKDLAEMQTAYEREQSKATDEVGKFGGEVLQSAAYVAGYDEQVRQMAEGLQEMTQAALEADPAVGALTEKLLKLIEKEGEQAALASSIQQLTDISRQAEEDITEARDDAQQEREQALRKHQSDVEKLEEQHGDRRADIMDDLADVQADLLSDMAQAEAEYQAERLELEREGIEDLAEQEREYAQAQAQLRQDLLDDLADADRQANEKRADAARDLARDLEDIERDSAAKIEDISAKHNERLLDLAEQRREAEAAAAEQHAQDLLALEERYARDRERIEERYRTEATEEELREAERKALLEHLEELRQLEEEGRTGIDYTQDINTVLAQLDELKQAELAALEEARQEELDALAAALAEEQAARQAAYEESIAAEKQRYQEELEAEKAAAAEREAERRRQYDRQIEDLNTSLAREKEARQRAYQEELADLQASHAQELAETQRANAEALAALDEKNEEEKLRLQANAADRRQALAEQLQDEQASYAERQAELETAYETQKQTIDDKLDEQVTTIQTKADEQTQTMVQAWENINPGIASALDTTINNVIRPRIDAMIAEIQRLKNEMANLGVVGQSPAPWWLDMGKSWGEGLEKGTANLPSVFDDQLAEMDKFKTEAERTFEVASPSKWAGRLGESVAAGFDQTAVFTPQMGAVPDAQSVALETFLADVPQVPDQTMAVTPFLTDMPMLEPQQVEAATPSAMAVAGTGTSQSVQNTRNFTVNAQYAYQSERSLRQDMAMYEMLMQ